MKRVNYVTGESSVHLDITVFTQSFALTFHKALIIDMLNAVTSCSLLSQMLCRYLRHKRFGSKGLSSVRYKTVTLTPWKY